MTDPARLLADLARAKAEFQTRTIIALLTEKPHAAAAPAKKDQP